MTETAQTGFYADLARLYPDLDPAFVHSVGADFEQVSVAGGTALLRRGETSDALYIVMSGLLVATREDEAGRVLRLGEIGRGELIGEMSVLSGGIRTATVTALRDSRLVRISNETFLDFMAQHPSVTRQFIQILTSRLTKRAPHRQAKLSTMALVPGNGLQGGDGAAEFARLAQDLQGALGAMATVAVIDRQRIESRFAGALAQDGAQAAITAWLDQQEQRCDILLYLCDPDLSAWTRLCLRQADRVLVAVQAEAGAAPREIERYLDADARLSAQVRGRELLLLQRADRQLPQGTARWLAQRDLLRHHHLRAGDAPALARLCRHLLGRSVGLALGGGGAKAFAEVGVLRALAEADVPIDVIGGTSMGAVVAALTAQQVHDSLRSMIRLRPFSGFTLPLVSLLSGHRLEQAMRALFGDTEIEDLWRRYFCVSCSLTHGSVKAAEGGRLRRWVSASCAVPGIMPPVVDGGELFVDGGLLNNVPADLMRARNAGPVIAVNVSSYSTMLAGVSDGADLSGWNQLLSGMARKDGGPRPPRLGRLLVRSMLLASSKHGAGRLARDRFTDRDRLPPRQRGARDLGPQRSEGLRKRRAGAQDARRVTLR